MVTRIYIKQKEPGICTKEPCLNKTRNVHLYSSNVFRRLRVWPRGTGGETPSIEKNAVNREHYSSKVIQNAKICSKRPVK